MLVELDRRDVVSLLRGTWPSYDVMHSIPSDLGDFHCEDWHWNCVFPDKYSDKELFDFYLMCKKSQKYG